MKNQIYQCLFFLAAIILTQSCSKQSDLQSANGPWLNGKTQVKLNEPDSVRLLTSVRFQYGPAVRDVRWTVTPSGFSKFSADSGLAVFRFTKAGNYKITATSLNTPSANINVTVLDLAYTTTHFISR